MKRLIIGLGKTGLSCLNYFGNCQDSLVAYDTRDLVPNHQILREKYPRVSFHFGREWPTFEGIFQAIISPGVPADHEFVLALRSAGIPVVSDIMIFSELAQAPILAITGTNGKSTTTKLVTHLLQTCGYLAREGGNIGLPVLDLFDLPTPDFYVLELSSFQLAMTPQLNALGAVLLNLTPDHLDRHRTMAAYQAAKMKIFNGARWGVIPKNFARPDIGQVFELPEIVFDSETLSPSLQVSHQQRNVAAALALLAPLGLPEDKLEQGLFTFKGLPHRCEVLESSSGITWVNDSKATNAEAAMAAIQSYQNNQSPLVLLAGGQAKSQDFTQLAKLIQQCVEYVVLFGEDADKLGRQLSAHQYTVVTDLREGVQWVKDHYQDKEVTALLSPACASYDQFNNFEHRGDCFKQYIKG